MGKNESQRWWGNAPLAASGRACSRGRWLVFAALWLLSAPLGATEIAEVPLLPATLAPPNVVFGLDDSGSMDWEVSAPTSDGVAWWRSGARRLDDGEGQWAFNPAGRAGVHEGDQWYHYASLFPNGCGPAWRVRCESRAGGDYLLAAPPIRAMAPARAAEYNPIYYDPAITYRPWAPVWLEGRLIRFDDADPRAVRMHPLHPEAGTWNLTAEQRPDREGRWFRFVAGMEIPGAEVAGIRSRTPFALLDRWREETANRVLEAGESLHVQMPWFPATYWLIDPLCTATDPDCAPGFGARWLRRIELRPENAPFRARLTERAGPVRNYRDALQNFANWFQYYRKRHFLLTAAMGQALDGLTGMRLGVVLFNQRTPPTLLDADASRPDLNTRAILGQIAANPADGATPTRDLLHFIGSQYQDNPALIRHACQRNAAFILTDGYGEPRGPRTPAYDRSRYMSGAPFTPLHPNSLADLAGAWFTRNLRPDLPEGRVPVSRGGFAGRNPDRNTNPHLNTWALTFGVQGDFYPNHGDPFENPPAWGNPQGSARARLDDLWHATLNGRGRMFLANRVDEAARAIQDALADIVGGPNAQSGVLLPDTPLGTSGESLAYAAVFSPGNWDGDLQAWRIDPGSGAVDQERPVWSASAQLEARLERDPERRLIVTRDPVLRQVVALEPDRLAAPTLKRILQGFPATPGAPAVDAAELLAWIRGSRALEGSVLRTRQGRLGDAVGAEPVRVAGPRAGAGGGSGYEDFSRRIALRPATLYQPMNDGMLHAFDAATGDERWAFIPSLVHDRLAMPAAPRYAHRFLLDATPVAADVQTPDGAWRTLLVGGMRAGGRGFYALDVTDPLAASETELAAKFLWEFPNERTPREVAAQIGLSFGTPVIVRLADARWAVLLTTGYNNHENGGDGRGRLIVLDAADGSVIRMLETPAGSAAEPSGLAQLSAWSANPAESSDVGTVYGGDELGNLWRFDLVDADPRRWSVARLARLTDAAGRAQAITSAPELTQVMGRRVVLVGTGRALGLADYDNLQNGSIYALVDDGAEITNPRGTLNARSVQVREGNRATIARTSADRWLERRGWYLDLPDGQVVHTNPVMGQGLLVLTSNRLDLASCGSESWTWAIDVEAAGQARDADFRGVEPFAGQSGGNASGAAPALTVRADGGLVAVTHTAAGDIHSLLLPGAVGSNTRLHSWQERSH